MGRKNRRKKSSYSRKMKTNPKMLVTKQKTFTYSYGSVARHAGDSDPSNNPDHSDHSDYSDNRDRVNRSGSLDHSPSRGEVWFADLGFHPGTSVQDGCRPVFIISNDAANIHSETITVVPMTSKLKKSYLPTHVVLATDDCPSLEPSMVLGEQLTTISQAALRHYVGRVQCGMIHRIEDAVKAHLGISVPDIN